MVARQNTLAEKVSAFQAKLVESVLTTILKDSKLQLDLRKAQSGGDAELVVVSPEMQSSIKDIINGQAGHGFFESDIELRNLLNSPSKPVDIQSIVLQLQRVSQMFHDKMSESGSGSVSTAVSYARIVEPRNSFMVHLKPDTSAAIQKKRLVTFRAK